MAVVTLAAFVLSMVPDSGDMQEESTNTGKSRIDKVLELEIYYSPACNCCKRYVAYLRGMNYTQDYIHYTVRQIETSEVVEIKNRFGIPRDLWSCHTIQAGGYFVEGHVPLEALQKLLIEKPDIKGIVLPKMPPGSPGMGGNKTEPFKIYYVSENKKGCFW
jgi:hypothetical protein